MQHLQKTRGAQLIADWKLLWECGGLPPLFLQLVKFRWEVTETERMDRWNSSPFFSLSLTADLRQCALKSRLPMARAITFSWIWIRSLSA
jgi:hypothetical protein